MLLEPSPNGNVAFVEMRRVSRGVCRIASPSISSERPCEYTSAVSKEIDACFQADFDEARGFFHVGSAPCPEEFGSATEGASAKAENRDLQAALS